MSSPPSVPARPLDAGRRPPALGPAAHLRTALALPPAALPLLKHRLSAVRWLSYALICVYFVVLELVSAPGLPLRWVVGVCALQIALTWPYRWWFATGRAPGLLLATTFAVDLTVLPVALAGTPRVPVLFHMLYLLITVPAALVAVPWGVLATVIASATHAALVWDRVTSVRDLELVGPIVIFLMVLQQSVFYSRRLADKAREASEASIVSSALLQVARELAASVTSAALLQRLAELARELTGSEWTCVLLRDPERDTVRVPGLVSRTGQLDEEIRSVEFPAGDLFDAFVAAEHEGVVEVRSAAQSPIPPWLSERWSIGPFLASVLRRGTETLGILLVGRDAPGPVPALVRRLLVGVAHQGVLALESASSLEKARAASALKSEFIGTMSHELRSPLNAIIGYADILAEEDGAPGRATREDRRDLLGRVRVHALQLLELIEATLDVSRLEVGRLPVVARPVDLYALFEEIRAGIPPHWSKPTVRLEWRVTWLPSTETDSEKLKTIVRNLAHNALKFTDRGTVTVDAAAHEGGLRVVVTDTGIGIPADRRDLIFEMFRQVDGSDSRRHGGVGLGLYIVKRLVLALGGTIRVDSEEGRGSRFEVVVPLRALTVERLAESA